MMLKDKAYRKTQTNEPRLLVVTGPESTGKTALAEALGAALNTAVVPEFARYFLSHLGRPYARADLATIARGQRLWMEYAKKTAKNWLVVDTDWTVLHVWEHYKYRPADFMWPKGYGAPEAPYLYLLCSPDFPWAPDPLREHPEAREELFEWYRNVLRQTPSPVLELYGTHEQRLTKVLQTLGF